MMPALLLGSMTGLCALMVVLVAGGGWIAALLAHAGCGAVATLAFALYALRQPHDAQMQESPATHLS